MRDCAFSPIDYLQGTPIIHWLYVDGTDKYSLLTEAHTGLTKRMHEVQKIAFTELDIASSRHLIRW